jgi:RNA polymerase sigma factor (sigma-70 family)
VSPILPYQFNTSAADEQSQNEAIRDTVQRERSRLRQFIRHRLPDPDVAEDVLQDVFYELTEAYRLAKPIERAASWLFAVARNKINDWYRSRNRSGAQTVSLDQSGFSSDESDAPVLGEWLAIASDTPDSTLFQETILEAIDEALAELPSEQREVFVRHEIEGQSFNDMAAELGVPLNTLLSRKRYAVLFLRERLRNLYDELTNQ